MMKKLLSFIFVFALTACASDRITLTVTVTNAPAGHDTFVVNGNTRTWTNSATASPSTLILIGSDAGESATNLWNQIGSYGYSGPISRVAFTSSNVFTLRGQVGQALSASISGTWATLSYSTQTVATLTDVRVPISAEPDTTGTVKTNIASLLTQGLNSYSRTAIETNTTLASKLVQTDGNQTILGTKTFGYGYPQFFNYDLSISNASPHVTLNLYDFSGAADNKWTQLRQGNNLFSIVAMSDAGADLFSVTFNPTTGRVTLGEGLEASYLFSSILTNGSVLNSSIIGTNTVIGVWSYPRANHSSLANGNNAGIDFGTNVFVKIKAGPTAAFALCGIQGGRDGREFKLYNATGQDMTILNDSGVEPTAANRIYTNTGATITITANGFAHLIYDSEDSRWVVMNYQP